MVLQFNPQNALLDFNALAPLQRGLEGYSKGVNQQARQEQYQNALAGGNFGNLPPEMVRMLGQAGPDKGPTMAFNAYGQQQQREMQLAQMAQSAKQFDASHSLARSQHGLAAQQDARDAQMQPYRMDQAKSQADATVIQRIGGVAQMIENEPDLAKKQAMWQQFTQSHPRALMALPQGLHGDPVGGARYFSALARGYQDPLAEQAQKAKMELLQAQAAKANNAASSIPLAAADKKAIIESDEAVQSNMAAITALKKAQELNSQAYSGPMASTRGAIGSYVGLPGAQATSDLENVVMAQALSTLKATFGAAPTEGERKILLDIQGSVNQPPAIRKRIYDRAMAAAEQRLQFARQQAQQMRGGTYYKPGGGGSAPAAAPSPDGAGETKTLNGKTYTKVNGQWFEQ